MKLTIIDWGAIIALGVFILIFPLTNGYIAMGVDLALNQIALIGSSFIQVPATILALYVGLKGYSFVKRDDAVKIPKRTAKTKKAGEFLL